MLDVFGPVEFVEVLEESFGIFRYFQDPLPQRFADDGMARRDFFLDFFVGQDDTELFAPVDIDLAHVGQAFFKHSEEDPLCPAEIVRVGCVDFTFPVIGKAHSLECFLEVPYIPLRCFSWMGSCFYGELLGWQAESVPSHRMQDIVAFAAMVAGHDICSGVPFQVAYMESGAAGIGEHVEHVIFWLALGVAGTECPVFCPVSLPFLFDVREIVTHAVMIDLAVWNVKSRAV